MIYSIQSGTSKIGTYIFYINIRSIMVSEIDSLITAAKCGHIEHF